MSTSYAFEVPCIADVKNTRAAKCNFDPKTIEWGILVPKGKTFTHAELLSIKSTLQDLMKDDNKSNRIFPIKRFVGAEDKSTEATYKEWPNGTKKKIRDGKYGYKYMYTEGATGLHTKLHTFDGKQDSFDFIFVDTKNRGLIMTSTDGMSAKGFELSMIDVPNFKMGGYSDPSEYYFEVGLENPDEMNRNIVFVPFPEDVDAVNDFAGLYDLEMKVHTPLSALGLIKLKFTTSNGAIDLYDDYNGELDTLTLYTATNVATGAGIDITSVTAVPGTKTLNVLLDVLDTDWPATAGGMVKISIGAVSDIETAGMPGYGEAEIITARL